MSYTSDAENPAFLSAIALASAAVILISDVSDSTDEDCCMFSFSGALVFSFTSGSIFVRKISPFSALMTYS